MSTSLPRFSRTIARVAGFAIVPLSLAAALAAVVLLQRAGWSPAAAAGMVAVGATVVLAVVERLLPRSPRWAMTWRSARIDLLHMLATSSVVVPLVRTVLTVAIGGWLAARLAEAGWAPWPSSWPVAVQVVLAIVVADAGAYAAHRWMHATDVGWSVHAVHHSPTGLNVLAAGRSHPFNAGLTYAAETAPLLLLGVPAEVLALWSVVKVTNGVLQHANIAYERTPLSWFLATPEVHRWHHAVNPDTSHTNYGNTTVVWDRLFGTLHLPHDARPGLDVGIADAEVPESYVAHLLTPWRLGHHATE